MLRKININEFDEVIENHMSGFLNIIIVNESHAPCLYLKDRILDEGLSSDVLELDLSENKESHEMLKNISGIPTLISIENCGKPKFITGVSAIISNLYSKEALA